MYSGDLEFLNSTGFDRKSIPDPYWLEEYLAPVWVMKSGKSELSISWDIVLPDGSSFLDAENSLLLDTCRRVLVAAKTPGILNRSVSLERLSSYYTSLCLLVDWIVLNSDNYKPKEYGFALLDGDALRTIIRTYVQGKADGLRGAKIRLARYFEDVLASEEEVARIVEHQHLAPKDLIDSQSEPCMGFTQSEITKIKIWLHLNYAYESDRSKAYRYATGENVYVLNMSKLCSFISYNKGHRSQFEAATLLFLRNFEYVPNEEKFALVTSHSCKEFLPSDYMTLEEESRVPATIGSSRYITDLLYLFCRLGDYVDNLPIERVSSSMDYSALAKGFGAGGDKHHRTTKPETALHIIDRSIEYLIEYGDAIVDTVINFKKEEKEQLLGYEHHSKWHMDRAREVAMSEVVMPNALKSLNIVRLSSYWGELDSGRRRNEYGGHCGGSKSALEMSLEDALLFLFSSVYILVASMSARRSAEIAELKEGCVKGFPGSYNLHLYLRKANDEGERAEIFRPVPDIVYRGVSLLERFQREFAEVTGGGQRYLFGFPHSLKKFKKADNVNFDILIERFSDYIGTEVIEENRRWYPKNHEFRRFFAIVFFWQYKFANLSAISWMLGHTDVEFTYAYIREICGGSEMTKAEAKYSADAVVGDENAEGIEKLKSLVKKHFNCNDVSLVDREELELYLEVLLEEEVYRVRPHSFALEDGTVFEMVFEVEELEGV